MQLHYLYELHWLPIKARTEFKLCSLTCKSIKFKEPKYLTDMLVLFLLGTVMFLRIAEERNHSEKASSYVVPKLLQYTSVWQELRICLCF